MFMVHVSCPKEVPLVWAVGSARCIRCDLVVGAGTDLVPVAFFFLIRSRGYSAELCSAALAFTLLLTCATRLVSADRSEPETKLQTVLERNKLQLSRWKLLKVFLRLGSVNSLKCSELITKHKLGFLKLNYSTQR